MIVALIIVIAWAALAFTGLGAAILWSERRASRRGHVVVRVDVEPFDFRRLSRDHVDVTSDWLGDPRGLRS